MADLQALFNDQRSAFLADVPASAALRREFIDRLLSILVDNAHDLADAIDADFGCRARNITLSSDIMGSIVDIRHTRSQLARWMKPRALNRLVRNIFRADLQPDPLGVVGVVAPWNFPIHLAVVPAASALAAGNRVMIKMSEKTPRTAELFATLVAANFAPDVVAVVTGGPEVAHQFCSLPFDHLFFTGSPEVGKKVMALAAENLTPVTLELGGKNPAVVAADADVGRAAERIMKGRLANGGQVCLCPDYALVPKAHVAEFIDRALEAARRTFPDPIGDANYCSLVDTASFDRVVALVEDAQERGAAVFQAVPEGGSLPDAVSRKIAPTILTNVTEDMRIDSEEVFGPLLTVYEYETAEQVIEFVNARPSPLAAYWYGSRSTDFVEFTRRTRSGGVARNDFALHTALSSAPFGGVGRSGMGAYHGKYGFDTFSHYKPVVGSELPFSLTSSTLSTGAGTTRVMSAILRGYGALVSRRLR